MRNNHLIRSDLPSGHVKSARRKRQLDQAKFGIYRPVTPECAAELIDVLQQVEEKANNRLEEKFGEASIVKRKKELGVTYLEQYAVKRAIEQKQLGIRAVQYIVTGVDDRNHRNSDNELEVDLMGFEWAGGGDRKLTGQIEAMPLGIIDHMPDAWATGNPAELFAQDTKEIGDLLREVGAKTLAESIRSPQHVSMFTYNSNAPDKVQVEQKKIVGHIAQNILSQNDITSVELGNLVVGNSYTRPIEWPNEG